MHKIIPGILEKNPEEIEKKLQLIKPFSRAVHIDILDGKFVSEESFIDPEFFKQFSSDFFLEAHFMVEDPTSYLQKFADAGFKRFLGHVEKMKDVTEFVALGQVLGEVGIALNYETPIDSISIPFDDLDVILLMTIHAGKSGQEFLSETLEKIKAVRAISQIEIEVDGGINNNTILKAKEAGATRFVSTSYILNSTDPIKSFETLSAIV